MKKEIEIPISELKTALGGLGKIIGKYSTLPVFQCVRVNRTSAGEITMEANNLDCLATYHLPLKDEGETISFLVPIGELQKRTKTAKDRLVFSADKKDGLAVRTFLGGMPIEERIAAPGLEEWPPAPAIKARAAVLEEGVRDVFKEAFECASEDESRLVLNSIHLDVTDAKAHYIISTNGRLLFSANSFCFDLPNSVTIPTSKFLGWNGWWKEGTAQIRVQPGEKEHPGWVQIDTDRWTYISKQTAGNYPNWKQVVPHEEPKTVIQIPADAVDHVLEIIARIPGDYEPNHTITLKTVGRSLILQGRNKDQKEDVSVPVSAARVDGKNIRLCLNRHYLAKALRFGLTEIHIIDELTPLVFQQGGKRMLIMPVRLDAERPPTAKPAPPAPSSPTTTTNPPPAEPTTTAVVNEKETTMTKAEQAQPPAQLEQPSAMKQLIQHVDQIKTNLKTVLSDLGGAVDMIRKAEKEQKATDKEIGLVREKLREIQSVTI